MEVLPNILTFLYSVAGALFCIAVLLSFIGFIGRALLIGGRYLIERLEKHIRLEARRNLSDEIAAHSRWMRGNENPTLLVQAIVRCLASDSRLGGGEWKCEYESLNRGRKP